MQAVLILDVYSSVYVFQHKDDPRLLRPHNGMNTQRGTLQIRMLFEIGYRSMRNSFNPKSMMETPVVISSRSTTSFCSFQLLTAIGEIAVFILID